MNFTQDEINFVTNVFASVTVNPVAPHALETVARVQTILDKINALSAEEDNGQHSSLSNRTVQPVRDNNKSNGNRKTKTSR